VDSQQGRVIVALDGNPVATIDDLHRMPTVDKIGKTSTLTVLRRSQKLNVEIVPRDLPGGG
jgi:S1-C subfamily serine protease